MAKHVFSVFDMGTIVHMGTYKRKNKGTLVDYVSAGGIELTADTADTGVLVVDGEPDDIMAKWKEYWQSRFEEIEELRRDAQLKIAEADKAKKTFHERRQRTFEAAIGLITE